MQGLHAKIPVERFSFAVMIVDAVKLRLKSTSFNLSAYLECFYNRILLKIALKHNENTTPYISAKVIQ